MKFGTIFLLLLLTSCVSTTNKLFYNKELKRETEVQLIKSSDFNIAISDYKLNGEIDSLLIADFSKKKIKLVNKKAKYVLIIDEFNYQIDKVKADVLDSNGMSTGNYGIQLNINLKLKSNIVDTLTKEKKEFNWNLGDTKPVHSDLVFDFFAVDSEQSFNPGKPLTNCFNAMSHKIVKFIEKKK
ncbi:hypothetical protein [Flavobacterium urocaniciphilum]|uniref:Lipopolysaccharide-assembly n=1 Tax=Flavobacterium urocaniciphilum TaxID=1299341 RepID=A0A1H9CPW3_9FLAO|nr:hypothetical protein [Flavobacterium urocaniciphilum]SEQ03256.1 hypothetical protein SAMN05444005_10516 [Flavobacterium urocaniciphilum]